MGVQFSIELECLPEHIEAFTEVEIDLVEDSQGNECEFRCEYTTLTAPDGTSKLFHRIGNTLWVDANPWGSNRAHYLPWLVENGIKFMEG